MANDRTEHLGLCQWAPGDAFLREEFNGDNAKVDGALHRTAGQLERLEYNVYGLMLQDYYEGRHTGWKRGLLFDGLSDEEGVAALSDTLLCNGPLELSARGQGDLELGTAPPREDTHTGGPWTAEGPGVLTGFRCKFYCSGGAETTKSVTYTVSVNGAQVRHASVSLTMPGGVETLRTITLPEPVKLSTGDALRVGVSCPNYCEVYAGGDGRGLGGTLYITPKSGERGVMTSRAHPLPASSGLLAWVRFSGGDVSLSVAGPGGAAHPMAPGGDRETVDLHGRPCTERAFRLDTPLEAGELAVRLELSLDGDERMAVYDYGVVVL